MPLYDLLCTWSRDDEFFLAEVNRAAAEVGRTAGARVLDLGCGTGRLTLAMVGAGHGVTGVDPAEPSLAVARAKPGAERVRWIRGTSADVPTEGFDVAVMSSHVAQFIRDDREWAATLADLRRALAPGGRLVFDSRDPAARGWRAWNPVESRRRVRLPDGCEVECWIEVTEVAGDVVSFVHHYRFLGSGEELSASATLCFRPEQRLRASLADAGFAVEAIYGGWGREPVGQGDGEYVVVARRPLGVAGASAVR